MNIKEVKDLIQEILASDICEFELEHTGTKVKLRRGSPGEAVQQGVAPIVFHASPSTPPAARPEPAPVAPASTTEAPDESGLHFITSPIVGTFYRSASPNAEPFVKIGDMVEEGKTLCIVEAMKLMNEIESDYSGTMIKRFVENGQPVEYGQQLFAVKP